MSIEVFTFTETMSIHTCPTCNMRYAAPEEYFSRKSAENGSWHCPEGHSVVFRESAFQKAQREAVRERENREAAERARDRAKMNAALAERRRRAAVGQVTKIKNRVKNGVCPCCNRHFDNLERHMKSKHPKFVKGEA